MDDDRLSEGEVEQEQKGVPFEYPDDMTPEQRWEFEQAVRREAALILGVALRLLVETAGPNPNVLAILLARAAGLTFEEIGARYLVSRQAAHKALGEARQRNPAVAALLADHHALIAAVAGVDPATMAAAEADRNATRGVGKWTRAKSKPPSPKPPPTAG